MTLNYLSVWVGIIILETILLNQFDILKMLCQMCVSLKDYNVSIA